MTIRWLHLSDVHENLQEQHHRIRMYAQIVQAVSAREAKPDLVFLTGDLAFAGTEAEYEHLKANFISPLKQALPDGCPVFTVPGNHDLQRKKSTKPRLWTSDPEEFGVFQAVSPAGAEKRKQMLLPRFAAYADFDSRVSARGTNEHATRPEEGALLGALLITRYGEDMRAHVRTLVYGLGTDAVVGSHSLRTIYTMVAAMHAENQLYLSPSVLAYAAGCPPEELEHKALRVLRQEAMLDAGDAVILTRHRRIAEAACAVLRDENEDVDRWYPVLAVSRPGQGRSVGFHQESHRRSAYQRLEHRPGQPLRRQGRALVAGGAGSGKGAVRG